MVLLLVPTSIFPKSIDGLAVKACTPEQDFFLDDNPGTTDIPDHSGWQYGA